MIIAPGSSFLRTKQCCFCLEQVFVAELFLVCIQFGMCYGILFTYYFEFLLSFQTLFGWVEPTKIPSWVSATKHLVRFICLALEF